MAYANWNEIANDWDNISAADQAFYSNYLRQNFGTKGVGWLNDRINFQKAKDQKIAQDKATKLAEQAASPMNSVVVPTVAAVGTAGATGYAMEAAKQAAAREPAKESLVNALTSSKPLDPPAIDPIKNPSLNTQMTPDASSVTNNSAALENSMGGGEAPAIAPPSTPTETASTWDNIWKPSDATSQASQGGEVVTPGSDAALTGWETTGITPYTAGLGALGMAGTIAGRNISKRVGGDTGAGLWALANTMNPMNQIVEGYDAVTKGGDLSLASQLALAIPTAGLSFAVNPIKRVFGW